MSSFVGTWNLVESENFEEFLKDMGLNVVLRKIAKTMKPTIIMKVDGDTWTMTIKTGVKTNESKYRHNEEFEEEYPNGDKSKSIIQIESPTRQVQIANGKNGELKTITELVDKDTMVKTLHSRNVVCKRIFKRA